MTFGTLGALGELSGAVFAVRVVFGITLVWAVAATAALLLQQQSAALRHRVWSLSIVAALAVPAATAVLPEWRVGPINLPAPKPAAVSVAPVAAPVPDATSGYWVAQELPALPEKRPQAFAPVVNGTTPAHVSNMPHASSEAQPAGRSSVPPEGRIAWGKWLIAAWLIPSLWLMLRFIRAMAIARMLRRRSIEIADGPAFECLANVRRKLEVRIAPVLLESAQSGPPVCLGWWRPYIVLPREWRQWPAMQLEAVLTHELAHVARRDVLWQILSRLACAVYWFHPLAWVAAWRVRVERELACDDWVLRGGESSTRYARWLLEVATLLTGRSHAVNGTGVAMAAGSSLENRIAAILDPRRRRLPLSRRTAMVVTLLAAALLGVIGSMSPLAPRKAVAQVAKDQASATPSTKPSTPSGAQPAIQPSGMTAQALVELREKGTEKPVPGAAVTIDMYEGSDRVHRASSDSSGRVTAALSKPDIEFIKFEVASEGWVPMALYWRRPKGDTNPPKVIIEMERATTIGGRVVDDAGQPISGATVVLHVRKKYKLSQQRVDVVFEQVAADGQGKWSYTGVPAEFDDIEMGVFHHQYASGPGLYAMKSLKPVTALRDGSATLTLKRGVKIRGVVRGPDGKPVAGAKVGFGRDRVASNVIPEQTTDADGRFTCAAEPGDTAFITIKAQGCAPELKGFTVQNTPLEVAFDLKPARTLTGRVVDESGKPIAGVGIYLDTWRGARTLNTHLETDVDGRFVWKDAPEDDVKADFMKTGFSDTRDILIRVGAANEVSLHGPTLVKGTVIDSQSGKPIPAFRFITGIDWGRDRPIYWQRPTGTDTGRSLGKNGQFEVNLIGSYPGYAIRIEAEGYLPANSEPFPADGKPRNLTFKLTRGEPVKGVVLGTDGKPLTGVDLLLVTPSTTPQLQNARIPEYGVRDTLRVATGPDGSFTFPPQVDPFLLVALHDSGYAQVTDAQWKTSPQISLKAWGVIQGMVKAEGKPAARQRISVQPKEGREDPKSPRVLIYYNAVTDDNGRFRVDRIIPGEATVARLVRMTDRMVGYSHSTKVTVEPGKVIELTIGGTGRAVVGRVAIPPEVAPGSWMPDFSSLETNIKTPALPEAMKTMTPEQRRAWYTTPEGIAYTDAMRRINEQRKYFAVRVESDGSFRIDDVPEGNYTLTIVLSEPPRDSTCGSGEAIASVHHEFTVPAADAANSQPLELPAIPVQLVKRLKVGDAAPDFAFKTLAGEQKQLEDYRGKYVLLDFWATWCAPCLAETPHLKSAYEAFGHDARFVMIGLSMDEAVEAPKKYVETNGIKWVQGFLGRDQSVPQLYSIGGIPSTWLIGPDGKVIAKNMRGEDIKRSIGQVMPK